MRAWRVLLCALLALLVQHCAQGKRFDPSMVDPLMRRSSLDKNFMRFGRSSPAFTDDDDTDENHDPSPGMESSKEDSVLRSMRAKDNFIRFGKSMIDDYTRDARGKQDNFMRFGRTRNDNFMRFGRGKQDNYMRFGRGKQDNYMRFGRGKQDNFMRFGKGKQDNYMRFGRGKQDNFMRFGRGKQDNFMRFGRVREDNYMRFGKGFVDLSSLPDVFDKGKEQDSDYQRPLRGKQDNFMRFGKDVDIPQDNYIPIVIRSVNPNGNSNFIRFGRARQDNFMRFGKSVDDNSSLQLEQEPEDSKDKFMENSEYPLTPDDEFTREIKGKDLNLVRLGRHPPNKNDAFMRFGRSQDQSEDSPQDLIPQRLKRSALDQLEPYPLKLQEEADDHILVPIVSLPEEFEDVSGSSVNQDDDGSRMKRSLNFGSSTPSPFDEDDSLNDYIYTKLQVDSQAVPEYQSSLLSAGLPNVIVGPELSLLPALNPPSTMLKSDRPGDKSFLRLG